MSPRARRPPVSRRRTVGVQPIRAATRARRNALRRRACGHVRSPLAVCASCPAPRTRAARPAPVPEGLPCGAVQQCSLPILSCPGELEAGLGNGPVDGYVCTCVAGRWSCQDCFPNDGPCTDAGLSTDAGTGPETDGGRGDGGFVTVLVLGRSDLCLPQPLPTAASGESTCSVIVVGLRESCAAAGLAPATAQEFAAVVAEAMKTGGLLPGSICELGQVAASTSGAGCSDPRSTSWCYSHGSCLGDAGTPCAEAICTTAAFQAGYIPVLPAGRGGFRRFSWGAYLLCP